MAFQPLSQAFIISQQLFILCLFFALLFSWIQTFGMACYSGRTEYEQILYSPNANQTVFIHTLYNDLQTANSEDVACSGSLISEKSTQQHTRVQKTKVTWKELGSCQHNKPQLPQTISLPSGHGIGSVLTTEIIHKQNQKHKLKQWR